MIFLKILIEPAILFTEIEDIQMYLCIAMLEFQEVLQLS